VVALVPTAHAVGYSLPPLRGWGFAWWRLGPHGSLRRLFSTAPPGLGIAISILTHAGDAGEDTRATGRHIDNQKPRTDKTGPRYTPP